MKNTIFIALAFIAFSITANAQDFIKTSEINLNVGGRNIKFNDITRSSITHLLGKPLKIKKERPETTNELVTSYIYKGGSIDFESTGIAFIEIEKPGWGFSFFKDGKLTPVFFVGTPASTIKDYFPYSLLKKGENFIRITIEDNNGAALEQAVLFEIKAGKVKSVSFFTDES